MFCIKCGAKIDDTSAFCSQCGAPVPNSIQATPSPVSSNPPPPPEPDDAESDPARTVTARFPIFSRVPLAGFVLACLCAFLPFINISCAGQKALDLNGFTLATGFTVKSALEEVADELAKDGKEAEKEAPKINLDEIHIDLITSLVLLLALGGIKEAFFATDEKDFEEVAACGGGCLIMAVVDFIYLCHKDVAPFDISIGDGYILFFLVILATTICACVLAHRRKRRRRSSGTRTT